MLQAVDQIPVPTELHLHLQLWLKNAVMAYVVPCRAVLCCAVKLYYVLLQTGLSGHGKRPVNTT